VPIETLHPLSRWAGANFNGFPHVHYGVSGTAMLFDALRQSGRRTVVLPAFICHSLSDMALCAGKRVVHIDVDRNALLMNRDQLEQCLAEHGDSESLLLVDHPFGYPCSAIAEIRAKHPDLLIVEDCVRALGSQINGEPVGRSGDWILLSLYKTIPGNDHGAIMLTRSRYEIRSGPAPRATLSQRLSTLGPARWVHDRLKRLRPIPPASGRDLEPSPWAPLYGVPNRLVLKRFWRELDSLEEGVARRCQAAREIQTGLEDIKTIRFVRPGTACRTSGYFLSFTVTGPGLRDRLLAAMHRKGLFLFRTWQAVPAYFRCFRDTFPFGSSESTFLAQHICHVPVIRFLGLAHRERLVQELRKFFQQV